MKEAHMFGLLSKAVVGGLVIYGMTKVLEKTGILDKIISSATDVADQVLTRIAEDPKLQRLWEKAASEKGMK